MKMKAMLIGFCLLLSCAWLSTAQEKKAKAKAKPDLSGTWTLDRKRSVPPMPYPGFQSRAPEPDSLPDFTLVISHHEPEIKITSRTKLKDEERTFETLYHTDGREETVLILWIEEEVKADSKTSWSGNTLVARQTIRQELRGYKSGVEIIDEWKLSKDGKTLSRTTRILSPDGHPYDILKGGRNEPLVRKDVFRRVEN